MGDGPYHRGASRRYTIQACEASLRRLGTDYIDLYYQHRPDPLTPVEETLDVLNDLVHQGKVRYIACSNFAGWQVSEAEHMARSMHLTRFVGNQFDWSLLSARPRPRSFRRAASTTSGSCRTFRSRAACSLGSTSGASPTPNTPASRTLTFFQGMATAERFDILERLEALAAADGRTITELAMSWLACQPGVSSVLAGATTAEQVRANAAAVDWKLSADDFAAVEAAIAG